MHMLWISSMPQEAAIVAVSALALVSEALSQDLTRMPDTHAFSPVCSCKSMQSLHCNALEAPLTLSDAQLGICRVCRSTQHCALPPCHLLSQVLHLGLHKTAAAWLSTKPVLRSTVPQSHSRGASDRRSSAATGSLSHMWCQSASLSTADLP